MEFVIAAYITLVLSSYASGEFFDKAYYSKVKRLGYVSTAPELYDEEAKIHNLMNWIKTLLICVVPLVNLVPICLLFAFESISDSEIKDEIREGKLRKITDEELSPKPEEGYLQRRIEEVKKFQLEKGHKNIPRTYSELSYDEKIDILLHELQLAYEEKAEAEGIDLAEVQPIYEAMPANTAPKALKKTN